MYNFYDKLLHKLGKEKGNQTIYINIGAMDGIMFDDSAAYVAMYEYKALYVEPIPYIFERLKENIKDPRAIFENSAISNYDGIIQMLTIDNVPIDNQVIHSCFYGMSAVYPPRNGLASDGDKEIVAKYGKFEVVPCMTLATLFTKHNIEHIDIISIDTEGHDWKILQQLDLQKYRPAIIRAEYINLSKDEQEELCAFFSRNNYIFEIEGQNIDAIPMEIYNELYSDMGMEQESELENKENSITIVTGLWNLGRGNLSTDFQRTYDHYKEKFAELLKAPVNMLIYVSEEDEEFIWQHRKKHNTYVRIFNTENFKTWFPFFDKVQSIRMDETWYEQAEWLTNSPQAKLELYNPLVMSKLFLLNDATLFNPFNSEYFYWIDAGIANTVHSGYFYHEKVFDNLPAYTTAIDGFLFLSYPYIGGNEIHGFPRDKMAKYCKTDYVRYVCRGGFFGGRKEHINYINGKYHDMLAITIDKGLMGTEESVFTIISHTEPESIHRFMLSDDGMIWPFFEKLKNIDTLLKEIPEKPHTIKNVQNIIYVLGYNSPTQFKSVVESIKQLEPTMFTKSRKILVNNSTDTTLFPEYDLLCEEYGFEEFHKDNLGVCGGRQFIAEHFDETDADFYMFFEDDMHLADPIKVGVYCKNGFATDPKNLYTKVIKIMLKESFDFLKFSFTEFYGNNNVQWAWYNVPQSMREKYWPDNSTLPENGLTEGAPKTEFKHIDFMDGTAYITGEVYYSNWPQIISRTGNKKLFLDTKWSHPYEQTWMSHIYELTKDGDVSGAILLASPIEHNRFDFYKAEERREN